MIVSSSVLIVIWCVEELSI